ncbi:MAG: hypothetical protein WCC91_02675 [Bradyrhizobium sp.]
MSQIVPLKNYDDLVSLSRVNRNERQNPFRNDRKGRVDQRALRVQSRQNAQLQAADDRTVTILCDQQEGPVMSTGSHDRLEATSSGQNL